MSHAFAFHGVVVKEKESHIVVSLFPGLVLDVRREDIEHIEQAEDPATGRTYVFIKLNDEADVNANFRPRLARLAQAAGEHVPFTHGGTDIHFGRHALPSGGAHAVPPAIDPTAVGVLMAVLPQRYRSALAGSLPCEGPAVSTLRTSTALGITVWRTNVGSANEPIIVDDKETDYVNDDE